MWSRRVAAKSFIILIGLCLAACNRPQAPLLPTAVPTAVQPTATAMPPTATAVPTPSLPEYQPIYEAAPCPANLPPIDIQCGFVIVPEDRYGDVQDTIRLAVARIASANPADTTPLIFLPGGPGSPAMNRIAGYYDQFIAPMTVDRDLIIFDARGVGLSQPALDCPELKLAYLEDLGSYFPAHEREEKYTNAFFTCRDRLQRGGANLATYSTAVNAADVKDILRLLGYEQAHLLGVSYGTRLAQQIMRDYPELVKSAILDSVVPLAMPANIAPVKWQDETLPSLFQVCIEDPACLAGYPNLAGVYAELRQTLSAEPLLITVADPTGVFQSELFVDDARLESALQWALPHSHFAPLIPQMLYSAQNGDGTILSSVLSLPLAVYGDINLGMMISVLCHDQVLALPPEALTFSVQTHPYLQNMPFISFFEDGQALHEICTQWGAKPFAVTEDGPLVSDIPTFILAGQFDATTPSAYGRDVAHKLSRSYFIELPNEGHTPSFGPASACVLEMVQAFLQSPEVAPDSACHQEFAQTQFFVPYDGTKALTFVLFTAVDPPFTVTVPAEWTPDQYNHFNWLRFPGDPTQLAVQASTISMEAWLDFLMENYAGEGLIAYPQASGEVAINGRIWQLYTTVHQGKLVTFAFTTAAGTTYHINLATMAQEQDALFKAVLVPVIESLSLEN